MEINTPLTVEEIDFRIQSINKGGYATILAYKDARADMKRLDEVFGVAYWQKKYEVVNGNLFCSVGIYNKEIKEWIWKEDVGTESMAEKEKGQASDAFKRACFNLGIGRELYDYPLIQIKLNKNEEKPKQGEWYIENDRVKQGYGLKLKEWVWFSQFDKKNKLAFLAARDHTGKLRFKYGEPIKEENKQLKTA
jgi:hypothetical protein